MALHHSSHPFPEALQAIMDDRDLSTYALADLAQAANNKWGSQSTMTRYLTGQMPFTMNGAEKLARALDIEPEYFAEYRLGVARAQLDPDQVGLKIALKNLARFER